MEFGAAIFFTDYSMGPVELGRALEERGFESLWAPEHSHIPLSRQSPFPQGGDLPKKYYDVMDPFVTLAAAAAATTRLKVGTGICLVVQRDPIQTAKAGGHARPGLGRPLPLRHRRGLERRGDGRSRHRVRVALQGDAGAGRGDEGDLDEVEAGVQRRVRAFPPMMTWPKPVQKPHPPVIVGGAYPYGARRAIAYGDGWVPHARRPAYGDVLGMLPGVPQDGDRGRPRPRRPSPSRSSAWPRTST